MFASQSRFGIARILCHWTLLLILFLILSGGCSSSGPTSEVDENLLLTPDMNHPTATPFQPGDGTDESPYYVPYASPALTSTLQPAVITPGTPLVEMNRIPTPFSSGYQGMPAFVPSTNTNPLTGLTATDPSLLERRPIAVKVTLFPRYVRPESGLTLADIVFEYYIEAGLTRFIAVF